MENFVYLAACLNLLNAIVSFPFEAEVLRSQVYCHNTTLLSLRGRNGKYAMQNGSMTGILLFGREVWEARVSRDPEIGADQRNAT